MNSQGLQNPFENLSLEQRIELLKTNGNYLTYRIYYSYKVSLFSFGKKFVEIWQEYYTNKITKVTVIGSYSVQKIYCSSYKINY